MRTHPRPAPYVLVPSAGHEEKRDGWRMRLGGRSGILAAIVLLAAALRLWGLNFGLPYMFHPDEDVGMKIALGIFRTGDLNPHFFNYPSLFFYIHAAAYVPYFLAGWLLGVFQTPSDITPPHMVQLAVGRTTLPSTVLLGRVVTAAAGLGVVGLSFLTMRSLGGRLGAALLAAALVAVSPLNVMHSRFIAPNMFLTFFSMLAVWGAAGILRRGYTRHYVLAGIAAGLAASSKYNGVIVLAAPIAAHLLVHGMKGLKDLRLYGMGLLSVAAFLATTPYALLDAATFLNHVRYVDGAYAQGEGRSIKPDTARLYISLLLGMEGPVIVLAALEVVRGLIARSKPTLVLASFPAVYLLVLSMYDLANDRQLLVAVPLVLMLAASFLAAAWEWIADRRWDRPWARVGVAVLVAAALTVPLTRTIANTVRLTRPDSRTTAVAWIERNIPPGSRIALGEYSPWIDPARYTAARVVYIYRHPPQWYVSRRFQYLIVGEGAYWRSYAGPSASPAQAARWDTLFRAFEEIKRFDDGGYEVRILRVPARWNIRSAPDARPREPSMRQARAPFGAANLVPAPRSMYPMDGNIPRSMRHTDLSVSEPL